jgi:hypothetical protein
MNVVIAFFMAALLMSWSAYAMGDYAYAAVSLGLALMLGWTSACSQLDRRRSKSF